MATGRKPVDSQDGFSAAIRRFPQAEFAIRKLMNHDEAFRDICEELAEAEQALARVPQIPAALHEARRAEWQELVDRLAAELATALQKSGTAHDRTIRNG